MNEVTQSAASAAEEMSSATEQLASMAQELQQLATLVESSDDAIVGIDLNRRITVWNRGAECLYGYTTEGMIGAPTSLLIPPDLEDEARLMRERAMQDEKVARYETTRLRKDGSRIMVCLTLSPIHDEEGKIVGFASTAHDIAARKKAEVALQESERQLTNIIEFLPDATLAIDKEERVIIWNKAIEKMTGIPAAEMIGKGDHAYTIPFYGEARVQLMDVVLKDCEEIPVRYSNITREGDTLSGEVFCSALYKNKGAWVFAKVSPLRDQSGSIVGAIESIRDITEQRKVESEVERLQGQLLQAQKMEAIGRLAGGVAHDFNNLLTTILGNVELIRAEKWVRGIVAESVEEIQEAGLRAAALTHQLLAFSRKQMLQPKVLDLNGLVENLSKMLRRLIGEDIALELRLGAGLGSVKADPGQIEQVILNLAVNARDAMSVGGRLVLETRNAASGETFGPGRFDIPSGAYVMLMVSDTGAGMDETVKAHLFEPFFTTKEREKGTGLGLSTVYGIVKQSEGHIFVDSEPGRGTSFTILLPRVNTEDSSRTAPPIERKPRGGTERILIVEDEPSVLQLAIRMLEGFGYTVIGVLTPNEALSLPAFADGRAVDLLITDVVLSGMKGTELARQLQERSPDLRVLFISGYTDETTLRDGALAEGNAFLPKPFSRNVLGGKVREILDSPRAR